MPQNQPLPAPPIDVALATCREYDPKLLRQTVAQILDAAAIRPGRGARVLVKPNLISTKNATLACTHPLVVRAACDYLLDHNAKVAVGDSPAFGRAAHVAKACGLDAALAGTSIPIVEFTHPRPIQLSFGSTIGVSATALDCDLILNIPKLKAHTQLRLTAASKNLFGCVPGTRKALAHTLHGDKANHFQALILEILLALPPTPSLLDAIQTMHVQGPINGQPLPLNLLAASPNPLALDTAIYTILGQRPIDLPLWQETVRRQLPGHHLSHLRFPLAQPADFDASNFIIPQNLTPITFHPARLALGAVKRMLRKVFPGL